MFSKLLVTPHCMVALWIFLVLSFLYVGYFREQRRYRSFWRLFATLIVISFTTGFLGSIFWVFWFIIPKQELERSIPKMTVIDGSMIINDGKISIKTDAGPIYELVIPSRAESAENLGKLAQQNKRVRINGKLSIEIDNLNEFR